MLQNQLVRISRSAFLLLLTIGASSTFAQEDYGYHGVKITSSSICIQGKTNINRFECMINSPAVNDSVIVRNLWSNFRIEFDGLALKYYVNDFECGIKAMNSDFQELLRSDDEPFLFLQLNAITICPDNETVEELGVDADVVIYLAGVEKEVKIEDGKVINHSEASMTLKGEKQIEMTAFGIDPPTKFLGLVKVTDEIQITFEIGMEVSALESEKAAHQLSSFSSGSNK